jgi:hypothetical protein
VSRARNDTPVLPPLETRATESAEDDWRLALTKGDELCRWEAGDGRWISVRLEVSSDAESVLVEDWGGRRRLASTFEEALKIARRWRT